MKKIFSCIAMLTLCASLFATDQDEYSDVDMKLVDPEFLVNEFFSYNEETQLLTIRSIINAGAEWWADQLLTPDILREILTTFADAESILFLGVISQENFLAFQEIYAQKELKSLTIDSARELYSKDFISIRCKEFYARNGLNIKDPNFLKRLPEDLQVLSLNEFRALDHKAFLKIKRFKSLEALHIHTSHNFDDVSICTISKNLKNIKILDIYDNNNIVHCHGLNNIPSLRRVVFKSIINLNPNVIAVLEDLKAKISEQSEDKSKFEYIIENCGAATLESMTY